MNILYYCDEYPPARNGGIGTVVRIVAEAMSQRGHKVVVAGKYWEGEGRETVEQIGGVTVIRWHKGKYNTLGLQLKSLLGRWFKGICKPQMVFSRTQRLIEDTVAEYGIDLVEVPDYVDDFIHHNNLVTPEWDNTAPKLVRVHGSVSFLKYYLQGVPDEKKIVQDQGFLRRSNAICAVSVFSKEFVQKYLCEGRTVETIYNPIESHWFDLPSNVSQSRTILFFGKIAKMKGVFSLIEAFNRIASDFPEINLKLVGSGNVASAKKMVDPMYSDRVSFSGFIPQDRIKEEIDRALFCVLPSYFENFSMAALEVLARNRALIYTTRASGPELIKDMENGMLVDPDDIEGLAERMKLLISDSSLRNRLAGAGYKVCKEHFSTDVIIPQLEKYYDALIQNGKNQENR